MKLKWENCGSFSLNSHSRSAMGYQLSLNLKTASDEGYHIQQNYNSSSRQNLWIKHVLRASFVKYFGNCRAHNCHMFHNSFECDRLKVSSSTH
jgi:hypothetical protein